MKVKHLFFSILVVAFLSSAIPFDKNIEIGSTAPKIETIEGINVGVDANSEGKTKLISFWSAKKPISRIANRNLSQKYQNGKDDNVEFITVCMDSDEDLMREVLKIDGINTEKSFSYSQISPRVFKDYGVEENPKAFLISSDGKILDII